MSGASERISELEAALRTLIERFESQANEQWPVVGERLTRRQKKIEAARFVVETARSALAKAQGAQS
jgi:hypothetical protein